MKNGTVWMAALGLLAMVSFTGCGSSEMSPPAATGMMGDSMMSDEKMMGKEKMGDEKTMTDGKMKEEKMMSGEKQ